MDAMLNEMKVYAHLKPGQDGTKRLAEKYGKALLLSGTVLTKSAVSS